MSQNAFKNLPEHVAVIMDGNGRWATTKGLSRSEGHKAGSDAIDRLLDTALELGLKNISLYAFSTENWKRPITEVKAIFDLLNTYIETKLEKIKKNGVRIIHSGARKKIPAFSMKNIDHAIHETRKNKQITLNFCLNYGSHDEIINAVNRILQSRKEKKIQVYSEIKKKELQSNLYTGQLPPVDLLIRTGGEHRLSNFLLWQSAYAEIYFTDILWPDFNRDTLFLALSWYQKRIRKFGGL